MPRKTHADRIAVLEAQVRSLQIAQPHGIRLVDRIEECERLIAELRELVERTRGAMARKGLV